MINTETMDASGKLFDFLINNFIVTGKKNDAALARFLGVAPPVISKIRHGRLPVGHELMIRAHDKTKGPNRLSLDKIRELIAL